MTDKRAADRDFDALPKWVPSYAFRYLAHTEKGVPIRALARHSQCHASTILRQIRRVESRRDDPLIDEALNALGQYLSQTAASIDSKETFEMTISETLTPRTDAALNEAAMPILQELSNAGAVLAVAADMEKAVVVRDGPKGTSHRKAIVDRAIAQAMALNDWISCQKPGRISRYNITAAGRAALGEILAQTENAAQGFSEAQVGSDPEGNSSAPRPPRRMRFATHESPLAVLARRRDKQGQPFLSSDLVSAGERLREDFEIAQMGAKTTQNWDRFLTAGVTGGAAGNIGRSGDAQKRLDAAFAALGEGLADVALRCCCFMEGMELAEKRLGWPARSGKVVLRIALIRLREHYDMARSKKSELIG
jgi:hypothetical protein